MLRYKVEMKPGGYTKEEVIQAGMGGADALILIPIMRGPQEGDSHTLSYGLASVDSAGYEQDPMPRLSITEVFQALVAVASMISQTEEAPEWQRMVSRQLVDGVRNFIGVESSLEGGVAEQEAGKEGA